MLHYILRRIGLAVFVAIFVSAISFFLMYASGDPAAAMLGSSATQVDIDNVRHLYGFDRPILVQYADWLWHAVHGQFGWSYYLRIPVGQVLMQRLPLTLKLGGMSMLFALAVGIPLGTMAAMRPRRLIDQFALLVSVCGQALPSFWFGLVLVMVFSVQLQWLPVSGVDTWQGWVLPVVVLGFYAMPAILRLMRAGMLDVLASDYMRTARSKGLSTTRVILVHALRNALLPVISLSAAQFGYMLAGSVVVESVFSIEGVGRLAWESISRGDLPTLQAIILIVSLAYVLLCLAADLINAWLDPRIRGKQ